MNLTLQVLESDSAIAKLIIEQIKNILDNAISKSLSTIQKEVKTLIAEALRNQPEYSSLMTGKLKAEFGIPDSGRVNQVIEALVNTLSVNKEPLKFSSRGISGGFTLTMIKSDDISGLIYTDIASVIDDKGYSLPWLEWLLLRGNQTIVKNYTVKYVSSARSRSGLALMYPSDSSSWRAPADFSGTEKNNWTTRAISSVESEVYKILQTNIEQYL